MNKDERIDSFINAAPDFAKPILIHLRKLVHQASPEITETIRWGMPFFDYKGMLCSMAAFTNHCAFNLMKHKQMMEAAQFEENNKAGMGHFGKITSLGDLPPDDVMIAYVQEAMKLNETKPKRLKKETNNDILFYPEKMQAALNDNETAKAAFEKMSYSHKKEYMEWIAEAKTEATRNKRIATMIEWLQEGKHRNWKYEKA